MSYLLRDMDNRDDDWAPWEIRAKMLAEFVPYVDGPLRGDVRGGEGIDAVDRAVRALKGEDLEIAERSLRRVGVYISEVGGEVS